MWTAEWGAGRSGSGESRWWQGSGWHQRAQLQGLGGRGVELGSGLSQVVGRGSSAVPHPPEVAEAWSCSPPCPQRRPQALSEPERTGDQKGPPWAAGSPHWPRRCPGWALCVGSFAAGGGPAVPPLPRCCPPWWARPLLCLRSTPSSAPRAGRALGPGAGVEVGPGGAAPGRPAPASRLGRTPWGRASFRPMPGLRPAQVILQSRSLS